MDLRQIKTLALQAIVSDDEMFETLYLKGGNAIDLAYNLRARTSTDLDFSMSGVFPSERIDELRRRFERLLDGMFRPEGYLVLDVRFEEKPENLTDDLAEFWGGYKLEFKLARLMDVGEAQATVDRRARKKSKILDAEEREKLVKEQLCRGAEPVGPGGSSVFTVDISRREYCEPSKRVTIGGYVIHVYTLEMLACEKLRAICQQLPRYTALVRSHRRARARDFFDIHLLVTQGGVDFCRRENLELIRCVFAAKRVELGSIKEIAGYREYHRPDFEAICQTVELSVQIQEFDFYFDFVVAEVARLLEALGGV